jgi:hypothetical protein
MARELWDKDGNRVAELDDGRIVPAPETGLLDQAWRQVQDLGDAAQYYAGGALGNEDWRRQGMESTRARQEQFAGTDALDPWTSGLGQAIPGALATARMGPLGAIAFGGLEGGADIGAGGSFAGRALAGGAAAGLGELGGRMAGRVFNTAMGLARDLKVAATGLRGKAANPAATAYEALGGTTLAHQRMAPGSRPQRAAERAYRYLEASPNPPAVMQQAMDANNTLHRNTVLDAIGLPRQFETLGTDFYKAAEDKFSTDFGDLAAQAGRGGTITLSPTVGKKIASLSEIRELIGLDEFPGLVRPADAADDWAPTLTGDEYMTARRAVAEAAAKRMADGKGTVGERLWGVVDELDSEIESSLPAGFLDQFARTREQYRVYKQIRKPNVIAANGQVNTGTLRRALESEATGFGMTAKAGKSTVNPESTALIDLIQAADNPEFKAPSSSGTAENLQGMFLAQDAGDAVAGLVAGDPRPALGLGARLMAPGVLGAASGGAGATFEGVYTPSAAGFNQAGRLLGRSYIDDYLYPFVGSENEIQRQ